MGKGSNARRLLTNGNRQLFDTKPPTLLGHAHNSCAALCAPAANGRFYEGAPYQAMATDFTLHWVRTAQSCAAPIDLKDYSVGWADYSIACFERYPHLCEFNLITDQSLGTEAKKLAQNIRKASQSDPRMTRADLDLVRETHVVHMPKSCYVTKSPIPEEDARTTVLAIIAEHLIRELQSRSDRVLALPSLDRPRRVYLDGFEHFSRHNGKMTRYCIEFGKEAVLEDSLVHAGEADIRLNAFVGDALMRGFRCIAVDSYDTDAIDGVAQLDFFLNSPHVPDDNPIKERLRWAVSHPSTLAQKWRYERPLSPEDAPVLVWSFAPLVPHLNPLEELSDAMWPAAYTNSHANLELLLAQMYTLKKPDGPSPVLSLLLLLNLCGCDYVMTSGHGDVLCDEAQAYVWREYKHNLGLLEDVQRKCDRNDLLSPGVGLLVALEEDESPQDYKSVTTFAYVAWNESKEFSMRTNMSALRDYMMCVPRSMVQEHLLRVAAWTTFYYCVYPLRRGYFIEECAPPCAAVDGGSVFGFETGANGEVQYARKLSPAAVREFADLDLRFGSPMKIYIPCSSSSRTAARLPNAPRLRMPGTTRVRQNCPGRAFCSA